jgi:hypothetical protein
MDTMQEAVAVRVPEALREIFGEWAAACDPAPLCHAGADPDGAAQVYSLLAAASFDAMLGRQALARVYADALLNMQFGQFAELRREGAAVFPWIAGVVAADPVLRGQLG